MTDLFLVMAHFNTSRKSPWGGTWLTTMLESIKGLDRPVVFLDWGSTDGSDLLIEKICKERGYDFFRFAKTGPKIVSKNDSKSKLPPFSWIFYWNQVMNVVKNLDTENILYIECDMYIRSNNDMLSRYINAMREYDIKAIKMARMVGDGIRPHWVETKLSDDVWLLPKFKSHNLKSKVKYKKHHPLISPIKISSRLLWNNMNSQCMMLEKKALVTTFDIFKKKKKIKELRHWPFWHLFNATYKSGLMDYLFAFNFGDGSFDGSKKSYKQGKSIIDKHWNNTVSEFCPESIIEFSGK